MRRGNLAIDERIAPAFEPPYQVHERHLGGVGFAAEHGFTEEGVTHGEEIKTEDEFSFAPGFDGMSDSPVVQHSIGFDHLRHDPCAAGWIPGPVALGVLPLATLVLPCTSWQRAMPHDLAEGGIESHVEFFPAQCLVPAARG